MCLCSHQVIITESRQNFQLLKYLILVLPIGQLLQITRLCVLAIFIPVFNLALAAVCVITLLLSLLLLSSL